MQTPRVLSLPKDRHSSSGQEAVELAAIAGLHLDPWQAFVLEHALSERKDGRWSAFEVGLVVSRQNGKGSVLEARELAGLFLLGEKLILHSAHEFKTAQEAFRRILFLIENTPDLDSRVARVDSAHGKEGIELKNGARLRFVARHKGSGRGFTSDCIIMDEAYELGSAAMAALLPTLSSRPNPQLWYASSAGMETSEQLAAVRERGLRGDSKGLAYFEWSADEDADIDDRQAWAQANPALGIRNLSEDFIEREREALPEIEFRRERLGIWDDGSSEAVIDPKVWADLADPDGRMGTRVAFAVDVPPDRSSAVVVVAGERNDGKRQLEVIRQDRGTAWVAEFVKDLQRKWRPVGVILDPAGPAGSLLPDFERAGVDVTMTAYREMAQACGQFYDAVYEGTVTHLDDPLLNVALGAARKRPLGDAWAWHRKDATADISPLVAVTLALFGLSRNERKRSGAVW